MLHPSYQDLMEVVNSDIEEGEQPVVQSRYSIVIATAKRARQIIAGAEPLVGNAAGKKPLSVAVDELYKGKVKIVSVGSSDEEEEITRDYSKDVLDLGEDVDEEKLFEEDIEEKSEEDDEDYIED